MNRTIASIEIAERSNLGGILLETAVTLSDGEIVRSMTVWGTKDIPREYHQVVKNLIVNTVEVIDFARTRQ